MTKPAPAPLPTDGAEPVAWRWKHRKEDASRWQYSPVEQLGFDPAMWEVEPLFAHPHGEDKTDG